MLKELRHANFISIIRNHCHLGQPTAQQHLHAASGSSHGAASMSIAAPARFRRVRSAVPLNVQAPVVASSVSGSSRRVSPVVPLRCAVGLHFFMPSGCKNLTGSSIGTAGAGEEAAMSFPPSTMRRHADASSTLGTAAGQGGESETDGGGLWSAYLRSTSQRPLATALVTAFTLWGTGDVVAQYIESRGGASLVVDHQTEDDRGVTDVLHSKSSSPAKPSHAGAVEGWFDARRWWATSLQGSLVVGGIGLYWYAFLERLVSNYAVHGTMKFVGMKMALEFAVWHPFTLLSFWTVVGLAHGHNFSQIRREFEHSVQTAFAGELALWTPIDILNFSFVPVHLQVLCISCGCLLEAVMLSYLHSQGGKGCAPTTPEAVLQLPLASATP